jgi:threonine/homoserine/homoserine lactone efflux protein
VTVETWLLFVLTEGALCLTPGPAVLNGFVLQVSNPKALVVLEFFGRLAYGALAGRLTSVATRPRFQTIANRVAGAMLVTGGVRVALQKNS